MALFYFPFVTSILKYKADIIYRYNTDTEEEKKKKMKEGTTFHKYCEDYLNGKTVTIPAEHVNMFEEVKDEMDKITEIRNIESLVLSEQHKYAGRPDLICLRRQVMYS